MQQIVNRDYNLCAYNARAALQMFARATFVTITTGVHYQTDPLYLSLDWSQFSLSYRIFLQTKD